MSDQHLETNESLLGRIKDPANEQAWSEFLAIYRPVILRMAQRRGLQVSDAEDLAQDIFVSISRTIESWQSGPDRPPFRAWLYKVTRNAIINKLQSHARRQGSGKTSVMEALHQIPFDDEHSKEELIKESQAEAFRWAVAEVRPEFSDTIWAMFWRTAVEGLPTEQVASSVHSSVGAVYVARWRVLKRIKERVSELTLGWELGVDFSALATQVHVPSSDAKVNQ